MKEIDTIEAFKRWNQSPTLAAIQGLDLRKEEEGIRQQQYDGSMFLGCKMSRETAGHIVSTGGMVISDMGNHLYPIHRARLYSIEELFDGFDPNHPDGYKLTYDYKVYEEYVANGMENPSSIAVSITRRLHDHSITDALNEIIENRKVVAIMGGHSMERQDPYYSSVARISRALTRQGFLMVSGGGPGAMEATHLGAYFAARPDHEMEAAINEIKIRPEGAPEGKEYADPDWLSRAWKIIEKYPIPQGKEKLSRSVGIPTWLYGHEPPAPFATHIAKYFANSVREDGLLTIAKHGVVFAPGSAGTTQEIFQDATQNHYAPYNGTSVKKYVSPMILFGVEHWTEKLPLWEFMQKASAGRPYGELLSLTDKEEEVIHQILSYQPEDYAYPKNLV